jgi:hypothetical protein
MCGAVHFSVSDKELQKPVPKSGCRFFVGWELQQANDFSLWLYFQGGLREAFGSASQFSLLQRFFSAA